MATRKDKIIKVVSGWDLRPGRSNVESLNEESERVTRWAIAAVGLRWRYINTPNECETSHETFGPLVF